MAKGKKKHLFLKIILTIIGVLLLLVGLIALANVVSYSIDMKMVEKIEPVFMENQLKPELDEETGFYTFTTDRDFKVLQLSDIHIGSGFLSADNDKQAIKAVETMIRVEKPDLVIITGDAFFPVPQSGTLNNASELKVLSTMMNNLGVYWAFCFGNHEYQGPSYLDESELAQRLEGCGKYCLFQRGPEAVSGEGNYAINVKNSDGVITRSFILLDSHAYPENDKWGLSEEYDNIHEDQVEWYTATVNDLNTLNKQAIMDCESMTKKSEYSKNHGVVKSFIFFHIPLKEYQTAWNNYKNNGYKNTADTKYIYGYMGETSAPYIFCGAGEDDLFERAVQLGSTQGLFCGHDHTNTFSFEYNGVRLTYGMSIDSLVYKNIKHLGSQRGGTLITSAPDGTFKIEPQNYYQAKYDFEGKEEVTMQTLNEEQEKAQNNG